jgi:RNA polymerase sigma-70 factor, ECF subfamily
MGNDFKNEGKKEDMLIEEPEIVERARTDDGAFEILYDFYLPKIYGYILKRVGSFDVAEDLASSTFLKVFTNLDKYQSKGHTFGAWIYKIATNNLIDYYRKSSKNKEINIESVGGLKDENNPPGKEFENSQEKKLVRQALGGLPGKYQEIINLKFFAEKDNVEIAEILKTSENNVRVIICRALKCFRQEYQKYAR